MAGQDIHKRLQPGQSQPVHVGGDFIFLKFADRPIVVIINGGESSGSRVIMEAGDKYRPGRFTSFEISNPDTINPAAVIFTVGEGDYNRQVVQGEVSIVPVLRKADGTTKPDTRFQLDIDLMPVSAVVESLPVGEVLASGDVDGNDGWLSGGAVFRAADGTIGHTLMTQFGSTYGLALFDENLNLLDFGQVTKQSKKNRELIHTPQTGWAYINGASIQGPLVIGSTAGLNTFFTWDKTIESATVDGDGNIVLIDRDLNVEKIDPNNWASVFTGTIEGPPKNSSWQQAIAYDAFYGRYYLQSYANGNNYILDEQFNVVETLGDYSGRPTVSEGRAVFRNSVFVARTQQVQSHVTKKVWRPYDTSPKIAAYRSGCGLVNALVKESGSVLIEANIDVSDTSSGFAIEGELIRAALEYYYRRAVPSSYLDHVYAVDATSDANGAPFKKISTGNETFRKAGVKDQFGAMAPGRITLTIDNELTLGGAL